MQTDINSDLAAVRVNGVVLADFAEELSAEALRQRACTELLRQAAQRAGLLDLEDKASPDGAISEAAMHAIEHLLQQTLDLPTPSEEDCRRDYDAHQNLYREGEQVRLRHILFAVTEGVDVVALRKRAENVLIEVRCGEVTEQESDAFAAAARSLSNCPSAQQGGQLGWLRVADCAPEFAKSVFGNTTVGVLPQLVHSRFGLHVVEILARKAGSLQPFDSVRGAVASSLQRRAFTVAMRHYIQSLAATSTIEGVDLQFSGTDLFQ